MSENVIEFPPRFSQREVWECNCGHRRFALVAGGEIACGQCDALQTRLHFNPSELGEKDCDCHCAAAGNHELHCKWGQRKAR